MGSRLTSALPDPISRHLHTPLKKTGSLCCEFNPKIPRRLQLATKFFLSVKLLAAELSFFKVS